MSKYIPADKLLAEIDRQEIGYNTDGKHAAEYNTCKKIIDIITSLQQEQPKVDYNKFEKLFDDFCERNKGHHITSHDACMWFWELGLNSKNEV